MDCEENNNKKNYENNEELFFKNENERLKSTIILLENEIFELKNLLNDVQNKFEKCIKESNLDEEVFQRKDELENYKIKNDILLIKLDNAENENLELQKNIKSYEVKYGVLKKELENFHEKILLTCQNEKNIDYFSEIQKRLVLAIENKKLSFYVEEIEKKKEEEKEMYENKISELNDHITDLNDIKENILQKINEQIQNIINETYEKMKLLQTNLENSDFFQNKLKIFEDQIENLIFEKEELKKKKETFESNKNLNENIFYSKKLYEDYNSLTVNKKHLESEIQLLSNDYKEKEIILIAKISYLESKIDSLIEENKVFKNKLLIFGSKNERNGSKALKKKCKIFNELFKYFQNKYENLFIENKKMHNEICTLKELQLENKKFDIENENKNIAKLRTENLINSKRLKISARNLEDLTKFVKKTNEIQSFNQEIENPEANSENQSYQKLVNLFEKIKMMQMFHEK